MITVHQLMFGFDRASNCLIFQGELEDGYKFGVAFPIGHVALTFDREASSLGYVGQPMLGAVDTIDSFIDAVEILDRRERNRANAELGDVFDRIRAMQQTLVNAAKSGATKEQLIAKQKELLKGAVLPAGAVDKAAKGVTTVASKAYDATIKKVGQQAIKVARTGVQYAGKAGMALVRSKLVGTALAGAAVVFPAVGAPALAAWGAANRAVNAYDAARAGVKGALQSYNTVKQNAAVLAKSSHPAARMAIAGLSSYRV
jgi:hypothetical protein